MSAPSSPGRTWRSLDPEHGLPAVAASIAAAVCIGRRGGACLSGLAGVAAAGASANQGHALHPVGQSGHKSAGPGRVVRSVGSLSLTGGRSMTSMGMSLVLLVLVTTSASPQSSLQRAEGVTKVLAKVQGIT